MEERVIEETLQEYANNRYLAELLISGVTTFFLKNPEVSPYIHTIKSRIKDPSHLKDKILRKAEKGKIINKDNLFDAVTDLAGIRLLHLYPQEFDIIHRTLMSAVEKGHWKLFEAPIAYTWDPESKKHFETLGLKTEVRDTYYTSIHYVIRPNNTVKNSPWCEIQVRTLFEEIWGEIDHRINYPHPTSNLACREQLRVLSKLVSTGTRLADSIYNCHKQHKE